MSQKTGKGPGLHRYFVAPADLDEDDVECSCRLLAIG